MTDDADYRALLARLRADPNVVGAVLLGSRAAPEMATAASDFDLHVVLREPAETYPFVHGSRVETIPHSLDQFRMHGLPGSGSEWNRPAFLEARVEIDTLDGEIQRLVHEKAHLGPEEAQALAASALGAYVNSVYRSLRNLEAGRTLAGRLDAQESIGPLLTTLFALEGRVRPFNKWLLYELERQPLAIADAAARVDTLSRDPAPTAQRVLFREVEALARVGGHAAIIDSWGPDVAWLRGESD